MEEETLPPVKNSTKKENSLDFTLAPPALTTPTFTRDSYIRKIANLYKSSSWIHIFGHPGVGKSTIVRQWLSSRIKIRARKVVWLTCSDVHYIDQNIIKLSTSTLLSDQLNYKGDNHNEAIQCVKNFIQSEKNIIWILDNITPETLSYIDSQLLCTTFNGLVISTSCFEMKNDIDRLGSFVKEVDYIEVVPLTRNDTHTFVRLLVKNETIDADVDDVMDNLTNGLPGLIRAFSQSYLMSIVDHKNFKSYLTNTFERSNDPDQPEHESEILTNSLKMIINDMFDSRSFKGRNDNFKKFIDPLRMALDLNRQPIPFDWLHSVTQDKKQSNNFLIDCESMGFVVCDRVSETFVFQHMYRTVLQSIYQSRSMPILLENAKILRSHCNFLENNVLDINDSDIAIYIPHIFRLLHRILNVHQENLHQLLTQDDYQVIIELVSSVGRYYYHRGQLSEAWKHLKIFHQLFSEILVLCEINFYRESKEECQNQVNTWLSKEVKDPENKLLTLSGKIFLRKIPIKKSEKLLTLFAQEILLQMGRISHRLLGVNENNSYEQAINFLEQSYCVQINIDTDFQSKEIKAMSLANVLQECIQVYRVAFKMHYSRTQDKSLSAQIISSHEKSLLVVQQKLQDRLQELDSLINSHLDYFRQHPIILIQIEINAAFIKKENQDTLPLDQRDYKIILDKLSTAYKSCHEIYKVNGSDAARRNLSITCQYIAETYYADLNLLKSFQFYLEMLNCSRINNNEITVSTAQAYYCLANICNKQNNYLGLAALFVNFALRDQNKIYNAGDNNEIHIFIQNTIDLALDIATKLRVKGALSIATLKGDYAKYSDVSDNLILQLVSSILEAEQSYESISNEQLVDTSEKILLALQIKAENISSSELDDVLNIQAELTKRNEELQKLKYEQDMKRRSLHLKQFLSVYSETDRDSTINQFSYFFEMFLITAIDKKLKTAHKIDKNMSKSLMASKVVNALSNILPELNLSVSSQGVSFDLKQIIIGISNAIAERHAQHMAAESSSLDRLLDEPTENAKKLFSRIHQMSIYTACCYRSQLEKLATNPQALKRLGEIGSKRVISYLCATSPDAIHARLSPEELVVHALVDSQKREPYSDSLGKVNNYAWHAVGLFKTAVTPFPEHNRLRMRKSMDAEELAAYGTRYGSINEYSERIEWDEYPDQVQAKSALERKGKCIIF